MPRHAVVDLLLMAGNEDDLDDSDRLSSQSVLMHCTYLVFMMYKDVSHVHFDGAHTTGTHTGLGCS